MKKPIPKVFRNRCRYYKSPCIDSATGYPISLGPFSFAPPPYDEFAILVNFFYQLKYRTMSRKCKSANVFIFLRILT